MKITVAMRVFGGFLLITLFLFAISISSLVSLSSIDSATEEVNSLAMPTVTGSNGLKVDFLTLSKLTFQSYYEKDLAALNEEYDNFQTYEEKFEQRLKKLKQVISGQPKLETTLATVESSYNSYKTNARAMFEGTKANLTLEGIIQNQLGDIEEHTEDTSSLLLDFSDSDAAQSGALAQAAKIGSDMETKLMSLVAVSTDYSKTKNLTKAETIGNELKLKIADVVEKHNDINKAAGSRDTTGMLSDVNQKISELTETLNGSNGLVQNQITRLNEQVKAAKALSNSEQNMGDALTNIDNLLNQANEKSQQIKSLVNDSVSRGTTITYVFMLISAVAAFLISTLSVRAITVPLNKVNDMLKIISGGDLTQKLDDKSDDEFGTLAKNCNNLIDSLKELIIGIGSRAGQLAAASEETSAVTTETTSSIQEQKSQIAQVATATTEMNSTSELVTRNAEDTLNQIKNADNEAERVKKISEENKNTIIALAREVESAAEVINKLHQDSASIGGILDVIRGVADQTNLLALNAAIEAARAGEQGRGFAVVADEVRTLASRTQESTQEIHSMIEMLQAGAEKAVAVMQQGKSQTELCVEQTETATLALNTITDAVHKAYDVSAQIEQSAREQNQVSQEISEKLESIVSIAEHTVHGAEQTSDSSHEVAKLAEELQESIRQFRV
ncbi:methyl-accepting chemotaxis protein [Neptunicella marina]|uniref:Methyl-accepting chemotaxis protein n=1 Tax=Neptunicella marina TaxID=2125989 RepID=A0A8J6IT82_9ALTE|nr:methyl-accepting chemotaxis protein [Neptunicella marina]MBC3765390.1 methyl-accepting chemotaxis protein [Neptunicella marina]